MFGRKKMYKKGLADAMKAYESFGRKQELALEKIREEVRNGNKKMEEAIASLGENIFSVFDRLEKQEKNALYHLATPIDIKELEDSEKHLLLAILFQLAEDEGSSLNDNQRVFLSSVQKYLEITNFETSADYTVIENISDLNVQKIIMRVALEFMYLQDGDELSEEQEEFFNNFSVNKRQASIIEFDVIRQFQFLGVDGIKEKYGSAEMLVFEQDAEEEDSVSVLKAESSSDAIVDHYSGIPLEIAEKVYRSRNDCIETVDYVIINRKSTMSLFKKGPYPKMFPHWNNVEGNNVEENNVEENNVEDINEFDKNCESYIRFDKETKEEKSIMLPRFEGLSNTLSISAYKNLLFYINHNTIYDKEDWHVISSSYQLIEYDVKSDTKRLICEIEDSMWHYDVVDCYGNWIVIKQEQHGFKIANRVSGEIFDLKDEAGKLIELSDDQFTVIDDILYFYTCRGSDITCEDGGGLGYHLGQYNMKTKKLSRTAVNFGRDEPSPRRIFNVDNNLYFYKTDDTNYNSCLILKRIIKTQEGFEVENCVEYNKECTVKLYSRYLAYLDIDKSGIYPLYVYDFEKKSSYKVAEHCYSRDNDNMNLIGGLAGKAKKKWKYSEAEFKMIGQWLYYTKSTLDWAGSSYDRTYRVNVNSPMNEVEVSE